MLVLFVTYLRANFNENTWIPMSTVRHPWYVFFDNLVNMSKRYKGIRIHITSKLFKGNQYNSAKSRLPGVPSALVL